MTKSDDTKTKRMARREALATLGALGPLFLPGCGSSSEPGDGAGDDSTDGGTSGSTTTTSGDASTAADASGAAASTSAEAGSCEEIPDETGGPYPDVDGMISSTTYQRSDITEGKTGTPLTVTLKVVDVGNACAPVVGARVIVWHCDANGVYSEYASTMNSDPAQGESGSTTTTYLRGWQVTGSDGTVTFTTIYPGWYTPRVTHVHLMVYDPSDLTTPVKTTQFCFPDAINETVYGQSSLYPKGQNTTTDASDMVFGASDAYLVASVTGDTNSGYMATLPVGISSS
jgi:protocatechuate 3,4-dioxygenase beta subunit